MEEVHKPVLLRETIEYLNIQNNAKIIDATADGGGHSLAILETYPNVEILAIEWDNVLAKELKDKADKLGYKDRIKVINDSYTNLEKIAEQEGFQNSDSILFDLGLSSWHYELSGRGFSFSRDENLDMRFNTNDLNITAAEIINTFDKNELIKILKEYGEEDLAEQIVEGIVKARQEKPIIKATDLEKIIYDSVPRWYRNKRINPATKTFQALRMRVNDELGNIANGLEAAIKVLKPQGRIVVISFHGIEDKLVKEFFKKKSKEGLIKLVKKGTIRPKWDEVKNNPRARSAKMKIAEKI